MKKRLSSPVRLRLITINRVECDVDIFMSGCCQNFVRPVARGALLSDLRFAVYRKAPAEKFEHLHLVNLSVLCHNPRFTPADAERSVPPKLWRLYDQTPIHLSIA